MKQVTKLLVNDFKLKQLGYDFMGYSLQKENILTYHHLIISREFCKEYKLGKGCTYENGCVLTKTSHEYLHVIERLEYEMFLAITSEIIDMKIKRRIAIDNLFRIWVMLEDFERLHAEDVTSAGKKVIKKEYVNRRQINLVY